MGTWMAVVCTAYHRQKYLSEYLLPGYYLSLFFIAYWVILIIGLIPKQYPVKVWTLIYKNRNKSIMKQNTKLLNGCCMYCIPQTKIVWHDVFVFEVFIGIFLSENTKYVKTRVTFKVLEFFLLSTTTSINH